MCLEIYQIPFSLSIKLTDWHVWCLHLQVIPLPEILSRCLALTLSTDFHHMCQPGTVCWSGDGLSLPFLILLLRLSTRPDLDIYFSIWCVYVYLLQWVNQEILDYPCILFLSHKFPFKHFFFSWQNLWPWPFKIPGEEGVFTAPNILGLLVFLQPLLNWFCTNIFIRFSLDEWNFLRANENFSFPIFP